jgi:hypothetical protein
MIISFSEVNYLQVLMASLVVIILGMFWYSPTLFGNIWVKLQGKTMEEISTPSTQMYIVAPLSALVSTWIIALLLTIPDEICMTTALTISILVGLFTSAKIAMNHMFESRPLEYYFITVGYHLTCCVVTGVILGLGNQNLF